MSNPLIPTKLPYVDENNKIEDVVNYMAKTINGATTKRISDSIEKTISDSFPVGTIMHSLLTEAQFQAQMGIGWVLMNGRSISGSTLSSLTGAVTIPDARGVVLRGKDHGAGKNPDGDTAIGTYQADAFESHTHQGDNSSITSGANNYFLGTGAAQHRDLVTGSSGGNETRMKNITVNIFIKIN